MKVDDRDPAELKPYPGNPRINDEAIEPVAASIKAYGFRQPIVVDSEDVIIVGHTRHAAALVLGLKSVPVHVAEGLTAEEIRAYRIADNSTGEISTWDGDLLAVELGELQTGGVDLSVMAFPDLDSLVPGNSADEVLEDEIPEPPAEPVTRPGDLWELGGHRVLCGDSTELGQVNRLSPEVDAVVTDPPYGVDYVGKTRDALRVQNDGKAGLEALLRVALEIAVNRCRPGACWYVTAPHGPQFYEFATVLRDLGIWRQTLIWVKQTLVLGHSDYHYQHESILYGWKPGADHTRPPDRKQTSLWKYDRPMAPDDEAAGSGGEDAGEQHGEIRDRVRPVSRFRDDTHRCGADGPDVLRDGNQPGLLRRDRRSMGEADRADGDAHSSLNGRRNGHLIHVLES